MHGIDNTIQHSKEQERMATYAKNRGFEKLKNRLKFRYGDELEEHRRVDDFFFKVQHGYESTRTDLYLYIKADSDTEQTLEKLWEVQEEHEDLTMFDARYALKDYIKDGIRETVFNDLDIETDIHIKVCTKDKFEREQNHD